MRTSCTNNVYSNGGDIEDWGLPNGQEMASLDKRQCKWPQLYMIPFLVVTPASNIMIKELGGSVHVYLHLMALR